MRDMGILRMFRGFNEFLDSGHYRVSNASSRADCLFSVAATLISVVHSRYRSEAGHSQRLCQLGKRGIVLAPPERVELPPTAS